MRNNLTIKQKKLLRGLAEGMPKQTAAIKAGYSKRSAHAIAHETLKKPEVLKAMKDILEESGLSDSYISAKLFELAEASSNGEANWTARARALDMLLKIKGHYEKLHFKIDPADDLKEEDIIARIAAISPNIIGLFRNGIVEKVVHEG